MLVPFAAPWRPAAVAAGVAGRLAHARPGRVLPAAARLIGQRGWRRLHYASFLAFVLALCHALASGTDLAGLGGPIVAAVAGGPVLFADPRPDPDPAPRPPPAQAPA